MNPTDANNPISEAVARAMSARLQRVGDMSRSHAPIDPERELAGIRQDVLQAEHELQSKAKAEQVGDQLLITSTTQALGQVVIAEREAFYGGNPLTATAAVEQTIKDSQAAGQHVELQKQRLLEIKNSARGETAIKPTIVVVIGVGLAAVAALAGMVPLIQRFLIQPGMENADPQLRPGAGARRDHRFLHPQGRADLEIADRGHHRGVGGQSHHRATHGQCRT
jgi:hypothetical protein